MEADCLEGDRSRGLPRWPARLRLRSGASAAAAIGARIGAMIVGTGARIAGTDGRDIPRFIAVEARTGGGRDLETAGEWAAHLAKVAAFGSGTLSPRLRTSSTSAVSRRLDPWPADDAVAIPLPDRTDEMERTRHARWRRPRDCHSDQAATVSTGRQRLRPGGVSDLDRREGDLIVSCERSNAGEGWSPPACGRPARPAPPVNR